MLSEFCYRAVKIGNDSIRMDLDGEGGDKGSEKAGRNIDTRRVTWKLRERQVGTCTNRHRDTETERERERETKNQTEGDSTSCNLLGNSWQGSPSHMEASKSCNSLFIPSRCAMALLVVSWSCVWMCVCVCVCVIPGHTCKTTYSSLVQLKQLVRTGQVNLSYSSRQGTCSNAVG